MTEGEFFIQGLPRKFRFHDRNERRPYETTRIVAVHLIDDPSALDRGRSYLERHMSGDPHQARYHSLWEGLLRRHPREIARLLLEDSPQGSLLRDTQPVFHVPTRDERQTAHSIARAKDADIVSEGLRP